MSEVRFTVIGVVGNARTVSLAKPDPMMVYVPYWYRCDSAAGLIIRTHQDPATMADAIRKAIWSVDPEVSVPVVRNLGASSPTRFPIAALRWISCCSLQSAL